MGAQHLHPLQVGALQNKSTVTPDARVQPWPGSPQTHVQVGAGQVRPFQVGAAQVGVHQVAAAEVGHLEVDVAEVEAGQVGAAEVKTLEAGTGGQLLRPRAAGGEGAAVPGSGAPTLWAWPVEIAPTLCGRWASGPPGAATSVHNHQRVRRRPLAGLGVPAHLPLSPLPAARRAAPARRSEPPRGHLEDRQVTARSLTPEEQRRGGAPPLRFTPSLMISWPCLR